MSDSITGESNPEIQQYGRPMRQRLAEMKRVLERALESQVKHDNGLIEKAHGEYAALLVKDR